MAEDYQMLEELGSEYCGEANDRRIVLMNIQVALSALSTKLFRNQPAISSQSNTSILKAAMMISKRSSKRSVC